MMRLANIIVAKIGKLPEDLNCGVLSEDLAYNMIGDMYYYALSQLEFVTNFLKKH